MSKSDNGDLKQLGSDASEVLGPLKKYAEDAFKTATFLVKSPNPKMAESLSDQIEEIISSANGLKGLLKELKAAAG
jgi:hypothetical protein